MDDLYTVENAEKYNWSSITGNLNAERIAHLEKFLIGQKILDAGCGGGAYAEFLCQKGLDVTGVDKYDRFLQIAREKSRLGNYIQSDIIALPFENKVFDCTYCFDVLEHVDDLLAITELARVTSKRLIISVPQKDEIMNQFGLTFYPYQDQTHLRYYTDASLKDLCQAINCHKFEIIHEGIIPFHSLFTAMFEYGNSALVPSIFRPIYKLKVSNRFLNKILNKMTDILLNSLINMNSLDRLLNENGHLFKKVNIGLVAIIDL